MNPRRLDARDGGDFLAKQACGPAASLEDGGELAGLGEGDGPGKLAHAVVDAIANKLNATANLTTVEKDIALVGGVARNAGIVGALKRRMGVDFLIPEEPEMAGALGAALIEND